MEKQNRIVREKQEQKEQLNKVALLFLLVQKT